MHLTPVQVAISVFGTPAKLSRAMGVPSSAPFRWMARRQSRGEPGDIPVPQIRRILEVAQEKGLQLTPHDLLYGREVADADSAPAVAGADAALV